MVVGNHDGREVNTRFLWTARGLGTLLAIFWFIVGLGHVIADQTPWTRDSAIMAGLMTSSIVGVGVSWKWEGAGGFWLATVGLAHMLFAFLVAGRNRGVAMLISGGPFLVVGIMFIMYWWQSHQEQRLA